MDGRMLNSLRAATVPSSLLFGSVVLAATCACGSSAASSAPPGRDGGGRGGRGRGGEGGAVPVVTAPVTQRDVPIDIQAIGNVEAFETVSVRSQVTGTVMEVLFKEGDFVKNGDHLFTIDRRPYEAQLQQARANLMRDEALLAQSEAQLARDKAQGDYMQATAQRNGELVERGIISKDLAQQSQAQALANAAAVKADQAAIESAKAQLAAQQAVVDNAQVQLTYTTIRSPINGRTGNLTMKPGNLATANATELVTIAQVEPVYVTFAIPATHLPSIRGHVASNPLSVVAAPQDAEAQPATGALAFVDNSVDPATDTIKLKARFDNTDHRLWPGQFARVNLRVATLQNAVVVPNQAIQTGQEGQFVFVVKSDATVEQRTVTVAQRVNDDVVVDKGLRPGETIVTEGQLRLEPGSKVQTGGGEGGGGRGPGRGGRGRRGGNPSAS
jgi:multidrug efflux system membrane fusion protein